jgi:hypothetical protein
MLWPSSSEAYFFNSILYAPLEVFLYSCSFVFFVDSPASF